MEELYHVGVEYDGKSYAVMGDLAHNDVLERIVTPWLKNEVFIVNGVKIPPEKGPVLKISRSELPLKRLIQMVEQELAQKRQSQVRAGILDMKTHPVKLLAVGKGTDVTDHLIEEARRIQPERSEATSTGVTSIDPRDVFVVYGRNTAAYEAMLTFLRALDLHPVDWNDLWTETGSGAPYVGEILDQAFARAQAVIVLLTPDESAELTAAFVRDGDSSTERGGKQPRPNVLFEAGMAFGRHSHRTVLVEFGDVRPFSDIAGRFALRFHNSAESRNALALRLEGMGCAVRKTGSWLTAGDFSPQTLALN